jgi:hypothetical protein
MAGRGLPRSTGKIVQIIHFGYTIGLNHRCFLPTWLLGIVRIKSGVANLLMSMEGAGMKSLPRLSFCILPLLFYVSCAQAGRHHICYQDDSVNGQTTAVWGCSADGGETCDISGNTGYMAIPMNPLPLQPGQYLRLKSLPSGRADVDIHFRNGIGQVVETRRCSVNIQTISRGAASENAILVGFTTDASGLVTTGVWKLATTNSLPAPANPFIPSTSSAALSVPHDFVVVGGGVIGAEAPQGALISQSIRETDRTWRGRTVDSSRADGGTAQPHNATVFAIGMAIKGLSRDALAPLIRKLSQTTASDTSFPTARTDMPFGFRLVGGGAKAEAVAGGGSWNQNGQYLTETAPGLCTSGNSGTCCNLSSGGILICNTASTWKVASKDHLVSRPGKVTGELYALPVAINLAGINYCVVSNTQSQTSALAAHPTIDVSGLRGEYALTGVGATVDWSKTFNPIVPVSGNQNGPVLQLDPVRIQFGAGNLLWKLEPRPDIGGVTVASKDHAISSHARITGYATGIKLVSSGAAGSCPLF